MEEIAAAYIWFISISGIIICYLVYTAPLMENDPDSKLGDRQFVSSDNDEKERS